MSFAKRLRKYKVPPPPSRVYDATALFGFGAASAKPLPAPKEGQIVLKYDGWTLGDLTLNAVVREHFLLWKQHWYYRYDWSDEALPSGIYRLRMPVAGSNLLESDAFEKSLAPTEGPAPLVLQATALLACRYRDGEDLLEGDAIRCKERLVSGRRAMLAWYDGRLGVYYCDWFSRHNHCLWGASVIL